MKNVYNSVLYVNVDMLRQNVLSVAETLPEGTKIIPVLKSDAYGMGMLPFARSLVSLPAVEMLAVAHVSEALELRAGGIGGEILVLGNPAPGALDAAAEAELTLTVGRLGLIPELASLSHPCRVEIKLDTGVAHVAKVCPVVAVTDRRRCGDLEEHVGGLAVEVVDAAAQTVLEELELETGVEVGIGLPGDVLGTLLTPLISYLVVVVDDFVGVGVEVVSDIVVTL